jgi:hypothetical protein
MLLNIVRLRYGDTPTFLDVSSVISAYSIAGQVLASGTAIVGLPTSTTTLPSGTGSVSVGGGYNDRPTISYTPLTGKKFAQSLLQPIPPAAIFSLIVAGYPVDVVSPAAIRALNGIYNHATQGGTRRPSDPEFYPLLEAWRRIQLSRSFSMRIEKRGDEQSTIGVLAFGMGPEIRRDIEFVRDTLHIKAKNGEIGGLHHQYCRI